MIADQQGVDAWNQTIANHASKGVNVAYCDGSVDWIAYLSNLPASPELDPEYLLNPWNPGNWNRLNGVLYARAWLNYHLLRGGAAQ